MSNQAAPSVRLLEKATPRVSVLLPNLNTRPFLEERFRTILDQTFIHWELIVVDNYSEDGAWELIQEFAASDARIHISQAPREGMYANWNNCLRLARSEYVYIATSDDTMAPTCLAEMVAALDAHPECDLAHCCLTVIDGNGDEIEGHWLNSSLGRAWGDLVHREHLRLAPYDGFLHCAVGTVYRSITQLLIRRTLFDRIGPFKICFGSMADFEWGLRACMVVNTVHIPRYLATWRVHGTQATQQAFIESSAGRRIVCDMIESAIATLRERGYEIAHQLNLRTLTFCFRFRQLTAGVYEQSNTWAKLWFLLRFSATRPDVAARFTVQLLTGNRFDFLQFIHSLLRDLGLSACVRPTEPADRAHVREGWQARAVLSRDGEDF